MRIVLSGGGTAGHITPLLAVARELCEIDASYELIFIGQKGDPNVAVVRSSLLVSKSYYIFAGKFRRFHSLTLWQNLVNFKVNLLNIRDAGLIVIGFFQALAWLLLHRPDAIFFKGGFVVVPVGFAARILRIPYLTHDSDPVPGLANKLIARGAKKNAVAHQGVRAYPLKKTVVTGIPLAHEYEVRRGVESKEYKKKLKLPSDSTVIFVYAGTQGSRIIDDALEQILPQLFKDYPKLHISYVFGRLNEESVNTRYTNLSKDAAVRLHKMTFVSNAYDYIAAADVIIGRAGATSLAEFSTVGRACIIIPAEQLTGGHQLLNAEIYEQQQAAVIVRESTLPKSLDLQIRRLLDSERERTGLSERIRLLAPVDAAKTLAHEICALTVSGR